MGKSDNKIETQNILVIFKEVKFVGLRISTSGIILW
jgi:hypothetical protein